MKFDYISILAGGRCAFACPFCIGQNVVEDKDPHYSDKWKCFLELFAQDTDQLSLSGSTSDPCFIGTSLNKEIVKTARSYNPNIKTSIHTRSISQFTKEAYGYCDKVVVSVDDDNMMPAIMFINTLTDDEKRRTRISVVITKENVKELQKLSFYEQFDGIYQFTIRQDVFEEPFEFVPEWDYDATHNDNGSIFVKYGQGIIAYWDYKNINPNLETRYLWHSGKVSSQCEWDKLH